MHPQLQISSEEPPDGLSEQNDRMDVSQQWPCRWQSRKKKKYTIGIFYCHFPGKWGGGLFFKRDAAFQRWHGDERSRHIKRRKEKHSLPEFHLVLCAHGVPLQLSSRQTLSVGLLNQSNENLIGSSVMKTVKKLINTKNKNFEEKITWEAWNRGPPGSSWPDVVSKFLSGGLSRRLKMLLINGIKDVTFIKQACQACSVHREKIITKGVFAKW